MAPRAYGLVLIPLAALAFAFLAAVTAPAASASHWCGDSTFAWGPTEAPAQRDTPVTVTITNAGVDTTQFSSVRFKFAWEGTWRDAGNGTILAGQSKAFTVSATPPSPGSYAVEVNATGTSSGDIFREQSACTNVTVLRVTNPPLLNLETAASLVAAAAAVAALIIVLRRKAPPKA